MNKLLTVQRCEDVNNSPGRGRNIQGCLVALVASIKTYYLQGKTMKNILLISAVVLVSLLFLLHLPSFVFSEYTGLYFYSSLIQANAAILSLLGVFIVFRIQLNKSSIENLKNFVLNLGLTRVQRLMDLTLEFERMNLNTKKEFLKEFRRKHNISNGVIPKDLGPLHHRNAYNAWK
jgi:hypothetical protein